MNIIVSIIIPTYNEAENILRLQEFYNKLLENNAMELIIVDGGSTDNTLYLAKKITSNVFISPNKGRASQMNYGAGKARGSILYFVHADVKLNDQCFEHITIALGQQIDFGCYRYQFDSTKKILRFNSYMTRFNGLWAGGGDQTLFIKKSVFEALSGFREDYCIMEDFDLVKRAKRKRYKFAILPYNIQVSARKYLKNSWIRVQIANTIIVLSWKLGASPIWMQKIYKKMLKG